MHIAKTDSGLNIATGTLTGNSLQRLLQSNMDPNVLRPYIAEDGRSYVTMTNNHGESVAVPTTNTATLRKDEWIHFDTKVREIARARLKAYSDLVSRGLVHTIPGGIGKTVYQYQDSGDVNDAIMSMDGLRRSERDRPEFDLKGVPIPIIHKDFSFSARELMVSRQEGTPLNTFMLSLCARKVAEYLEKLLLGLHALYTYATYPVYGYTNFPLRNAYVLTAPTAGGWTPATLITQVIAMKKVSKDDYHYGPWVLYVSPDFDTYLEADYSAAKGDNTVRQRIRQIEGITDVVTLDYLTGTFQALLVQMSEETVQMLSAMEYSIIQWDTEGGMELNFKVMTSKVPLLRGDQNGNTGIVHAAPA